MRRILLATVVAIAAIAIVPVTTAAHHDVGPDRVYVSHTGHYMQGEFLSFWRHNGGVETFGYPITSEFEEDGMVVQYFERAVFEWHPDAEGHRVQLRLIGVDKRDDHFRKMPFEPVEEHEGSHLRYFPQTGFVTAHGFLDYWEANGGVEVFGYPISREFHENGKRVQYFERAVFEWHPDNPPDWQVTVQRIGAETARNAGVDRSPRDFAGNVPEYDPTLWFVPTPHPRDPTGVALPLPGAPSHEAKWIEVDKTNQVLRAWEGQRVVFAAIISTGLPLSPTLNGTFRTYWHLVSADMEGESPYHGEYHLEDVPYIMYYDGGYGIHGTYWHQNFGRPQSNGCVNLTRADAQWLFNWTPLGTVVWVHGTTPGA
jgi:lipoprotein-anchoring transpeptidase ErfK/SrfK